MSRPIETLSYLRSVARPGECIFCGEPAKKRSATKLAVAKRRREDASDWYETCGDSLCFDVAYNRCYKREQRLKRGIKPRNLKESDQMSVGRGKKVSMTREAR